MNEQMIAIRPITAYRGVTKLARRLGVSQTHLSRVLAGERKPGAELAAALRRAGVEFGGGGEERGERGRDDEG